MKKLALVVALFGLLVSCGAAELYTEDRAVDKTIMVPTGLRPVPKAIKEVFKEAGWKTVVAGKSLVTSGTSNGSYVNLSTKTKYPARYSVLADSRPYDYCIDFTQKIIYDISILDNVTGEEVAAFSGWGCGARIKKKIRATLDPFL